MNQGKLLFPQPLYEKYRPRIIDDFVGLLKPKRMLEAFIRKPFDFRWFFLGPTGVGKTSFAEVVADQINAEIHQIPSRSCDLDTIAFTTRMCHNAAFNFKTGQAHDMHAVIVNEANGMTSSAQDWLLSKLDSSDPPPRTVFFFTANSVEGLQERFLSRCETVEFTRDSLETELASYLQKIYKKEGGRHPLDFAKIATVCKYDVRASLNKIQSELLLGDNRKGLPTDELKILPTHLHECEKCKKPWKCSQLKCKLPHVTVCPECGGAKTVGSLRAKKAWVTITKNIEAKVIEKQKRKGKVA